MNLYKELWSRIGGRPWTFISRDVWHQIEYVPIVVLLMVGFALGRSLTWWEFGQLLIAFTIGYILGHFFWGRDYIKNQQGK